MSALRVAHLNQFITTLPQGIDTKVGERGTKISGGAAPKVGYCACDVYRKRLLVLDEATS